MSGKKKKATEAPWKGAIGSDLKDDLGFVGALHTYTYISLDKVAWTELWGS